MKKLITLLYLLLAVGCFAQSGRLKFENGTFRILQLTDLHWVPAERYAQQNDSTLSLIRRMIELDRPNLVVLTGDVVVGAPAMEGWKALASLFAETKTPFLVNFGNHDTETDLTKSQILAFLEKAPYSLYDVRWAKALSGGGNGAFPVYASEGDEAKWVIYAFDSHSYPHEGGFGAYDWIKYDQIAWYREMSEQYGKGEQGGLPSVAFFHIPLPEHETARYVTPEIGYKKEGVCAPNLNSGLFTSFIEKRDVLGVFVGHDHNNDYLVDVNGNIALAYGRKTGYPAAYTEVLDRGGRLIVLQEDRRSFDSYVRDLKGTSQHYTFSQKKRGVNNVPVFDGTFIQEFLVNDWDDARWSKEFEMMREAGMEYLIFAPALLTDSAGNSTAIYPSRLVARKNRKDLIERCLRNAQKQQIKVFLGLNFNDRWWRVDYDADWLFGQMEQGNKVADELNALYKEKYPETLYGWYWVWEVDNLNCTTPERQAALAQALNINLDHLSKITPGMPLMLSPFMNSAVGNADDCKKLWESVFAQTRFRIGDIFSPQDCVGAGGLKADQTGEWFSKLKQAVNTKPGLKFWGNVETFDQRDWSTAPFERIARQLHAIDPYVSNIICFSYNHYNSPYLVDPVHHDSYMNYRNGKSARANNEITLTKERLLDKIKGGWAGKTIGCTYGGPVEFLYNGTMIQDYTPIAWNKDKVKWYYDNFPGLYDDVYVDIVFVDVMKRHGINAPADSFATSFASKGFPLWHANQVALYNIRQGIMPPQSGHWLNNPHADDIDYQIEADFAGLTAPGMPNRASEVSDRVGHIFTYGDGWYGGVYVGALLSEAFVEEDMERVVEEALKTIPQQSDFYRCIRDVIGWYRSYPEDWKRAWFECEKKWSSETGCPDGVFVPFNIDAKMNSAYVTIGLLYGKKDFYRTMDIAARCGQDSDCNAATAAAVLGTLTGYDRIPEMWKEALYEVADLPFAYTDVSLNKLYELTYELALETIRQEGGSVQGNEITIRTQDPVAVRYEKSFEGHYPAGKIAVNKHLEKEAKQRFDGIGFVQKGFVKCQDPTYVARAEMWIDGKRVETINLPAAGDYAIDSRRVDLFHRYQLPKGEHEIAYRWLNPREDARIYLGEMLIYSDASPGLTD